MKLLFHAFAILDDKTAIILSSIDQEATQDCLSGCNTGCIYAIEFLNSAANFQLFPCFNLFAWPSSASYLGTEGLPFKPYLIVGFFAFGKEEGCI